MKKIAFAARLCWASFLAPSTSPHRHTQPPIITV